MREQESRPLIAHVIHRLQIGGLENGLVNLINNLPHDKYHHAIICLTESSEFSRRIRHKDVSIYELHKKEGKDPGLYLRLWKVLRELKPTIVHSRNISTIEAPLLAMFAGVPIRVHGEHGRDIYDVSGDNKKYQRIRRLLSPFIHRFVPMSKDLESWLINVVRISPGKITQLYNGVDICHFSPRMQEQQRRVHLPIDFATEDSILIGTVGRLEAIKDQLTLVRAFVALRQLAPDYQERLRLVLLGDGSQRSSIESLLDEARIRQYVWLAGSCDDVADILPELDIFVLPSRGEGISNTILEAMASQLPVVATRVGGNGELVVDGVTGALVPPNRPQEMAHTLYPYVTNAMWRHNHGLAGRERVEKLFSIEAMMTNYSRLYDDLLT